MLSRISATNGWWNTSSRSGQWKNVGQTLGSQADWSAIGSESSVATDFPAARKSHGRWTGDDEVVEINSYLEKDYNCKYL